MSSHLPTRSARELALWRAFWPSLQLRPVPDASGPGFFSDGDMLQSCNFGKGRTGGDKGGMKQQEYQAQFAVWAVLASPMIISADLRSLAQAHPDCLAMLKSPEVLAVNQDPAAHAPIRPARCSECQLCFHHHT